MRLLSRRILVVLIALGFIASGFGRASLAMAASEPCHTISSVAEQHMHEHGDTHATHDHAAHHAHEQGDDTGKAEDACFKCCGICTASLQLSATIPTDDARLVSYRLSYFVFVQGWADRPLVIDPGIPKRIV